MWKLRLPLDSWFPLYAPQGLRPCSQAWIHIITGQRCFCFSIQTVPTCLVCIETDSLEILQIPSQTGTIPVRPLVRPNCVSWKIVICLLIIIWGDFFFLSSIFLTVVYIMTLTEVRN